jgi:zinc transporter ZupT
MHFWEYLVLFLAVIFGGAIAFFPHNLRQESLKLVVAFTGAYVLGVCLLDLLPSIYLDNPSAYIGLWIAGGFLIQLLLEHLSMGLEHGHIHAHSHEGRFKSLPILLGLSIHAFIEGMPLSGYHQLDVDSHHHAFEGMNYLLISIILHKVPAAFALAIFLLNEHTSKKRVMICLGIFAVSSPLGALSAQLIQLPAHIFPYLLAIVVGSFLHIGTTIIYEADYEKHHRISLKKLLLIVLGLGLSSITLWG